TLPISGAEVRLGNGTVLASTGKVGEDARGEQIPSGDELRIAPSRQLSEEEGRLVEAVGEILGTALARLRGEERMRHEAVHDALQLPVMVDGIDHSVSASIGIALGHADPDGLLGSADAAVYRAKAHGRGRVELFR